MKRTLGAGMDNTTNKETSMGTAIDMGRNSKKRKIVNEGVGAEVDAEGGGPLNVNKNEIRDGVEKPASLKVEADTEGWTKVGKKSKKTKKEKKKIESQIPRFMYSNGDIVKRQHAVGVEEIRDLAIHLLLHEGRPPSFIRIEHTERIAKVVILLVPGITPDVLNINIEAGTLKNPNLPMTIPFAAGFIPNTFSHACPTRAPGDQSRMFSVLGTFLNVRVSGGKGHAKDKRNAKGKGKGKPIEEYMLTIDQMVQNGYPVPSYLQGGSKREEEGEGWVETPMEEGEGEKKGRKAYGIDCEMVLTEDGKKSLARVCMVDYETGVVAYDTLVKSDQKVVDYLTRWSGITEEKLSNATTTFAEAQAAIVSLLSNQSLNPILIGHSLESDLKSLKLSHPFCIDTSLLYAHPRGKSFKPGLAWLTKKWCGREIQTEGGGHDPEEDARAAIELVREKIKNGPSFGVEHEELFDLLGRKNVRTAFVDRGTPAQSQTSTHTQISCSGDDEVVENIVSLVPQSGFIFGRLLGLAESRGWVTPRSGEAEEDVKVEIQNDNSETANVNDEPSLSSSLQETSTRLQTIYSSLPTNTALLVFSGHQDPRRMGDLSRRRAGWEKEMKARVGRAQGGSEQGEVGVEGARWTTADMRELESEIELAKKGLLFLGVKP